MDNELLEFFGVIVKESRNAGLDIIEDCKKESSKNLSDSQQVLTELLNQLNSSQQESLKKSVKYCIELSLFKLINTIENGTMDYDFNLDVKKSGHRYNLVGENDNDLSGELWNWFED